MDKGDVYFIISLVWTALVGFVPVVAPKFRRWRAKRKYRGRHRRK